MPDGLLTVGVLRGSTAGAGRLVCLIFLPLVLPFPSIIIIIVTLLLPPPPLVLVGPLLLLLLLLVGALVMAPLLSKLRLLVVLVVWWWRLAGLSASSAARSLAAVACSSRHSSVSCHMMSVTSLWCSWSMLERSPCSERWT